MKTLPNLLRSLALASLLAPLALLAEDDPHIPVGSRAPKPSTETVSCDEKEEACGYVFDRYPPVYYPSSVHWFIAVSALGDSVELEDGSVWKISSYDGYKALNWRANDPLIITQNFSWFSNYTYRIVNKNTGASIEATLFLGPIRDGQYSRFIADINYARGELVLNDNTHWEISRGDASIIKDWAVFDYVIIGQNGGWSSTYENLLINVNMNNYVHSKEF